MRSLLQNLGPPHQQAQWQPKRKPVAQRSMRLTALPSPLLPEHHLSMCRVGDATRADSGTGYLELAIELTSRPT